MKLRVKLLTVATAFTLMSSLWADTFTFQATTDFTDINAGEVPYYRHNGVNALAINAAIESYRDRFARATVEFEEASGVYDVTITALGEIDGDGEFRFLLNGEVVGSADNEPVSEDYGEQQHTFENVSITQGSLIGVESIAVSNGLIPEGEAYAYARGRWTRLTLVSSADEQATTPGPIETIDLAVGLSVAEPSVMTNDAISYTIIAENLSTAVATNPLVEITLPTGIANVISDVCTETATATLSCELTELAAGESTDFTISATAASSGQKTLSAVINADQEDDTAANNSATATVEVLTTALPTDDTVDLQLLVTADRQELEVGDSLTYLVTINNQHEFNTATSPVIAIVLPDSLQFEASDKCAINDNAILCNLVELTPGASTTAQVSATAVTVNSFSQLIFTASSAQPENSIEDNESLLVTVVNSASPLNITPTTEPQTTTPNTATTGTSSSNGGGMIHFLTLLFLVMTRAALMLLPVNTRKT